MLHAQTDKDLAGGLQRALERERASREILSVISRSRQDERPVFETVLKHACALCDAPFAGLYLLDEAVNEIALVASRGARSEYLQNSARRWPLDDPASVGVSVREGRIVQTADIRETAAYREGNRQRVEAADIEGIRTFLAVPLLRDGRAIGCIGLYRREVALFSDPQVALVESFAEQALIAIENVRQFREVQARLEREEALRDILQVISQSRGDEAPVFDRIVEIAQRLCDTFMPVLVLGQEGDPHQRLVAHRNVPDEVVEIYHAGRFTMNPRTSITPRAIIERRVIHISDMADTAEFRAGDDRYRSIVNQTGTRTNLMVPLVLNDTGIGCLFLPRREVRPYTSDEVLLAESFAAQAVIAIENAQQFRALRDKTREVQALNAGLENRVQQQVDEIERIGRLKRFLSPAVAHAVMSAGDETMLSSHRALIAVMFCDIRGFTAFCETAEPEESIEVLQRYHEEMGTLLAEHGAGVDTRAGDGIMVLFNDPLPCDDPAGQALRLGLAMRAKMEELCEVWKRHGHMLGFGVGISLGYATVGLVGSEGRYDYTASGTVVNLAARLCDHAEDGDILLSPRAFAAVEQNFAADAIGKLSLKGLHAPVEVYRVRRAR